jgi:hypothetical protein
VQSFSFSSITRNDLAKLDIMFAGVLTLKHTWQDRVLTTTSLGNDQLWTSENFYRQLHLLETLVPRTVCQRVSSWAALISCQSEATARAWIDVFFFRVSAMLPADKRMVLNMEHAVPATTISSSNLSTISGYVDYTAFIGSKSVAGKSCFKTSNLPAHFFAQVYS